MLQAEEKGEPVTTVAWENMNLEQRRQSLDELRARAEEQFEIYFRMNEENKQQSNAVFQRELELRDWEHRLSIRENELGLIANLGKAAGSTRDRAKELFDRVSNSNGWRGETHEHDAHQTRVEVKRLAEILKQARSANTAIGKVMSTFRDIMVAKEVDALAGARFVLQQIAEAAQLAKEQGVRLVMERQQHEEAVAKAASAALQKAFGDVFATPAGKVLFIGAGYSLSYAIESLVNSEANKRSNLVYCLSVALEEAQSGLASKIRAEINKGVAAAEAAQDMRAEFDDYMPELRVKYGDLAQRVTAELVARQMERANN